jgi:hypothetical protein
MAVQAAALVGLVVAEILAAAAPVGVGDRVTFILGPKGRHSVAAPVRARIRERDEINERRKCDTNEIIAQETLPEVPALRALGFAPTAVCAA